MNHLLCFTQENVDILIKCVIQNIGFDEGKLAAAVTIYKSLLHWKLFEAEKTSVFDRLIQMIGCAIEVLVYYIDLCLFSSNYNYNCCYSLTCSSFRKGNTCWDVQKT